jgi:CheY-like chemotaxis protein
LIVATCTAVLIVEDDPEIRDLVATFLESEGFQVFRAENGQDALEQLQSIPEPALILADLMMPVMDGPALIAALRAHDRFATLPVVLVTAQTSQLPKGYRHVKKPIDLDDLARIVGEFCVRRN